MCVQILIDQETRLIKLIMAWAKRAVRDLTELVDHGFEVLDPKMGPDWSSNMREFLVTMNGPKDTIYENAQYHIHFTLDEQFPFKSPSVGFIEKIWHPNIDYASGSVCLDSLNSKWSPVFTLRHVVDSLLPYLLSYPNPEDPLNREAAAQMKNSPNAFATKVRDTIQRYSRRPVEDS